MYGGGGASRTRACIGAVVVVALTLAMAADAWAASGFDAHGSVEQVYVTGLASSARVSLLGRSGRKLMTKRADSLGALVFRNVKPGSGYRVRLPRGGGESGPLT